jgi:oxaloacetate decarboxylase alpha subunit
VTRPLGIWETALRDGQQSLWATRMTTPMIAPVLGDFGTAGYWCVEVMSGAVYEAAIHYNAEDPWDRVRRLAAASRGNHVAAFVRSLGMFGWSAVPAEVFPFAMSVMARNGIDLVNVFDGLNDPTNMAPALAAARAAGLHAAATLIFTESPLHTDAYYAARAADLLAIGIDSLVIEDAASVLSTERLRTLLPVLRDAVAGRALFHFQTHCASGLGVLNALEAVALGVDVVHAAISPLAHGASNPPTEQIVREARASGCRVEVDAERLDRIAAHFRDVALATGNPLGRPVAYDPGLARHQVPGGMRSNLERQLAALGMGERLPAVLEEIAEIRRELGWPVMVTPISQFVGVQALFNVVEGKRYATVQADLADYVRGRFGAVSGRIDPDVHDRLSGGRPPIAGHPVEAVPPVLDRLRAEAGPGASDEDIFLMLHATPALRARWRRACAVHPGRTVLASPLATLVRELTVRPVVTYAFVRKGRTSLSYTA